MQDMVEEIPDCCHSTHLSPQVTSEAKKRESEMPMIQHFLTIKLEGGVMDHLGDDPNYTWETTLSITPPESEEDPRAGARESSSSKKMTHGHADLAWY
jgi:hypothetical protein